MVIKWLSNGYQGIVNDYKNDYQGGYQGLATLVWMRASRELSRRLSRDVVLCWVWGEWVGGHYHIIVDFVV